MLDAALDLFSEHGFDGTTLQQIADRLGITKAALYYYYPSPKDDLLTDLVGPSIAELDALLSAHEREPDTPARRRRFLADYIDYMLGQRRLIAYMVSDIATVAHPAISTGSAQRRARFYALVAGEGLDFNDQVRVTMAFRGIGGVIAQYPDASTDQLRQALLDAVRPLLRTLTRR